MRSALYYPHTHISSIGLIKTALLLWDKLEYIVPSRQFRARYSDRHLAEAMEMIGKAHPPTLDEKQKTHLRLEELLNSPLPPQFYWHPLRPWRNEERHYAIYPEKFLPESWDLLQRTRVTARRRVNSDYALTDAASLAIMSILADCCAGKTRSRVTDRGDAYATVLGSLGNNLEGIKIRRAQAHSQLVPISVRVIDASKIDIKALIRLRRREEKEPGKTLRDLRHRYIEGLETYIEQLSGPDITSSDVEEIKRQFASDTERDIRELKAELGFARTDALTSKEFIATVLTGIATTASWLSGLNIPLEGVVSWGGVPAAIGGLVGTRSKYMKERDAIMRRHPMAYLYEVQESGLLNRAKRR